MRGRENWRGFEDRRVRKCIRPVVKDSQVDCPAHPGMAPPTSSHRRRSGVRL